MRRAVMLALGAALLAGPVLLATPSDAAAEAVVRKGFKIPKNAYGQPDISGNWSNSTLTRETRPANLGNRLVYTEEEVKKIESAVVAEVEEGNESIDPNAPAPKAGGETKEGIRPEFASAGGGVGGYDRGWLDPGAHVMRVNGEPRTSFVTTPNGQEPPRKATAKRISRPAGLGSFNDPEARGLGERCIMGFGRNAGPPMFPNGFYNNNYQIVQAKDHVAILVEMVHDTRIIRLNDKHRTDGVRPWMGDSVGRYEGNTLVVETVNIPQEQAYRGAWEQLKVTERFTRVAPDRLHYAFTVEDPTVWDAAWGGEYEFSPLNGEVLEYACHEGNYALPGILAGAREEEKAKARGAAAAAPAASAGGGQ